MTNSEPTKSGVIGMIASAMGRSRSESVSDLISLRFGVRADQTGKMLRDFHTAHSISDAYVTNRYYLADAVFLVGLEGERSTLKMISDALRHPSHPLSLGRRSCTPVGRMVIGIFDGSLVETLKSASWMASEWYKRKESADVHLELTYDALEDEKGVLVKDVPISFSESNRQYSMRNVIRETDGVIVTNEYARVKTDVSTDHDPFKTIRGD
jgi:CRISPR system Cascade subunit CasD